MSAKELICILLLTLIASSAALAEDVKVEGIATQKYSLIGGSGWKVDIDKVVAGPVTLQGTTVSAGTATVSPAIPRGTIDPSIAVGDRVEVFGALDAGLIKLYGSSEYYIKKTSGHQIPSAPSGESEADAKGAMQLDSCAGNYGWQGAPEVNVGEAYTSSFCPFSGGKMFMPVYRAFNVWNAGQITVKVTKVPSNGIIMIWLQEVNDPSTKVSSPNIFDDQGLLIDQPTGQPVTLSADVSKPAQWGIMIQCATVGELQDSEYSFAVTQGCDWTGRWDLDSSPSNMEVQMDLQQSGDTVTGSYSNQGRISATVSGNKLQGTWAEPPDYSEPRNKGAFEFTLSEDCNSFSGSWGLGSSGSWMGQWNGKRAKSAVRGQAAISRGTYRGEPPNNTSPDYVPPDLWPTGLY